jgi:hypothetical protein
MKKHANANSPQKLVSKKSRGNNTSLKRNLFPDDEKSTSEEENEDEEASE